MIRREWKQSYKYTGMHSKKRLLQHSCIAGLPPATVPHHYPHSAVTPAGTVQLRGENCETLRTACLTSSSVSLPRVSHNCSVLLHPLRPILATICTLVAAGLHGHGQENT